MGPGDRCERARARRGTAVGLSRHAEGPRGRVVDGGGHRGERARGWPRSDLLPGGPRRQGRRGPGSSATTRGAGRIARRQPRDGLAAGFLAHGRLTLSREPPTGAPSMRLGSRFDRLVQPGGAGDRRPKPPFLGPRHLSRAAHVARTRRRTQERSSPAGCRAHSDHVGVARTPRMLCDKGAISRRPVPLTRCRAPSVRAARTIPR